MRDQRWEVVEAIGHPYEHLSPPTKKRASKCAFCGALTLPQFPPPKILAVPPFLRGTKTAGEIVGGPKGSSQYHYKGGPSVHQDTGEEKMPSNHKT